MHTTDEKIIALSSRCLRRYRGGPKSVVSKSTTRSNWFSDWIGIGNIKSGTVHTPVLVVSKVRLLMKEG